MKSNTAYKLLLSLLVFAAATYGFFYMTKAITSKSDSVRVERMKESQNKNFEFGNQLRENLSTLSGQETFIESAFIGADGMIDFIQRLESVAATHDLDITIDKVEEGVFESLPGSGRQIVPVTFTVQTSGSYYQTRLFIDEVLNLEQRLGLTQVHLYESDDEYTARILLTGIMLSNE